MDEIKKRLLVIGTGLVFLLVSIYYDNQVVDFFNDHQYSFLTYYFTLLTNFLVIFLIFLVMSTIFLWKDNQKEWAVSLWISFLFTAAAVITLKLLVGRARPFDLYDLYTIEFVNYAFPSLHTAAVFSLVPILDKEYPWLMWFWIILAIVIAISRLYLGVHYMSDVIAGAVIGYAIGASIIYIKEKYFYYVKFK